jgi:hypothetical protein
MVGGDREVPPGDRPSLPGRTEELDEIPVTGRGNHDRQRHATRYTDAQLSPGRG